MLPMLVVKRIMNTIKQFGKGDNVHQKTPDISQFLKNNNSINVIKSVFNVNLHHDPFKV